MNTISRRQNLTPFRQHVRLAIAGCLVFTSIAFAAQAVAADSAESRGKRIYTEGTSESGIPINAIVGEESVAIPGSALPCEGCHGPDGRGRPEGGVLPPDIRWSQLVKTYGHVHENGRRHPAFDENTFAHVIRAGSDPADNGLDRAMPLYEMSDQDMADLIAYLKLLENERDPGVSNDAINIATVLPLEGQSAPLGQAMAQVLYAYFQDVSEAGGVFGRRVELLAIPAGDSPESTVANLEQALAAEDIFAVVGAYTVGADAEILDALRHDSVPLVGPLTLDPGDAFVDAAAFYLYPGLDEQARVLADRALESAGDNQRILIVAAEQANAEGPQTAVREQLERRGGTEVTSLRYAADGIDIDTIITALQQNDTEALIFLGDQAELEALMARSAEAGLAPTIYSLASMLSRPLFDAPQLFNERIVVAYPTYISDLTERGRTEYQSLAERHALPREHIQAQLAALAAAKLFVEGLQRSGRELSRLRLVESLEAVHDFQTGFTPLLTYGPNRRIGAWGAHLMNVDLINRTYTPVDGGWHRIR